MKLKHLDGFQISSLLIGLSVFAFMVVKASTTSFTHDESFTYLHFPSDSILDLLTFKQWHTNNHILNSILMKHSEMLFGASEWALRLPNLLLMVVYLIYAHRLFARKSSVVSTAAFILLCTNPLLTDLFGLARGYGLSYGFMMMGLFHFIQFVRLDRRIDLYLFHLAALLGALSNFTLLTVYLALLVVFNVQRWMRTTANQESRFHPFHSNKQHLLPLFFSALILFEPVRKLIKYHRMDFGGHEGFFQDTVAHLVQNSLHAFDSFEVWMIVIQVLYVLIVLAPSVVMLQGLFQKRAGFFDQHIEWTVTTLLLLAISAIIVSQHLILGTAYPIQRFSMYLFPLLVVHVGFLVQAVYNTGYEKTSSITISVVALASLIGFIQKQNLTTSAEWGYDAHTKDMLLKLEERVKTKAHQQPVRLGIHWMFEPTINFYRQTKGLDWLEEVNRDGLSADDDYFYVFQNKYDSLDASGHVLMFEFERSETVLFQNPHNQ